jgi:hypothetical protein
LVTGAQPSTEPPPQPMAPSSPRAAIAIRRRLNLRMRGAPATTGPLRNSALTRWHMRIALIGLSHAQTLINTVNVERLAMWIHLSRSMDQ